MAFDGYTNLDDLKTTLDVGTYYYNDELKIWVDEFTFERDFVSVIAWYAENMEPNPETGEPDYESAEFEFSSGYYTFDTIQIGPFYVVLNYDIDEDPYGEEGVYSVYICENDFFETYLSDVYEVYEIGGRRGDNYQDALATGKKMFAGIGDNNKYGATYLYLTDVVTGGSDNVIDEKELSVE